jgi:hypothetical protein
MLEEYQHNLEQAAADVADLIRQVREDTRTEPTSTQVRHRRAPPGGQWARWGPVGTTIGPGHEWRSDRATGVLFRRQRA